jgi:hypothetical protein
MARLECLGAKHGDCLVLHHGTTKVLFDGGPSGVYGTFLKPWIEANKPEDGPVFFDLGMVTHIDDDHINGLLALTDDMVSALDDGEGQSVRFGQFWFNSFSGLTGKDFKSASVAAIVASASDPAFDPDDPRFKDKRTGEIIASVKQGHKLSNNLGKLGLGGNGGFDGLVQGRKMINLSSGLVFEVIGPLKQRLSELREEWDKTIPVGTIAAFTDKSVPNLSSIVIIVSVGGKTMLMTGDARGDDILEYLEAAGHKVDGTQTLDVMKVPHHGSMHNVTLDFFKALPARTYVISADGRHDNPDAPTIQWIAEARGAEKFEYVFASPMNTKAKQKALDDQLALLKPGRNFTARFRKEGELSISVEL